MTELKMIIETSRGEKLEQILKNEKDFSDFTLQLELDTYINKYIQEFNKENIQMGTYLKSLQIFFEGNQIRNITKNEE